MEVVFLSPSGNVFNKDVTELLQGLPGPQGPRGRPGLDGCNGTQVSLS